MNILISRNKCDEKIILFGLILRDNALCAVAKNKNARFKTNSLIN